MIWNRVNEMWCIFETVESVSNFTPAPENHQLKWIDIDCRLLNSCSSMHAIPEIESWLSLRFKGQNKNLFLFIDEKWIVCNNTVLKKHVHLIGKDVDDYTCSFTFHYNDEYFFFK